MFQSILEQTQKEHWVSGRGKNNVRQMLPDVVHLRTI